MSAHRTGTILILVAGLCAVIAALALAFLARMRLDAEEGAVLGQEVQARTMLGAGLQYLLETSRIGWDADPSDGESCEAYGWVDVRDGGPGPKDILMRPLFTGDPVTGRGPAFPAVGGRAARCPMHLLARPPSAVEMTIDYNPLPAVPSGDWRKDIGYPNAEPRPVADPALDPAARFAAWAAGDPRPIASTIGAAWFRIYRMTPEDCAAHRAVDGGAAPLHWSPGVFIVTCGAGGTHGWRDWAEVQADLATGIFAGDPAVFAELRRQEVVQWFACEWHPSVATQGIYLYPKHPTWLRAANGVPERDSQFNQQTYKSFGGTILWIERLLHEPPAW